MITKSNQADIITDLDTRLNISDVYFHRGQLHVLNAYDFEQVEEYLMQNGWINCIECVPPEEYSPFETVNS